jgi:hypothetical protein
VIGSAFAADDECAPNGGAARLLARQRARPRDRLLQLSAARIEGNWLRGAASSVGEMRAGDAAEGAQFTDGLLAVIARVNPALVHLSQLVPPVRGSMQQDR